MYRSSSSGFGPNNNNNNNEYDDDPQDEDDLQSKVRTRSGYEVGEVIRAFQITLGETGPLAAGRCIHYSADIICSGALQVWMRHCMEYAVDHIGCGAPRIFFYLKKRFEELNSLTATHDTETLYNNYELQMKVGEIVLILKDCIRRTKVALPKIHSSCFSEQWLAEARSTNTNFISTQRVYRQEADAPCMNIVGNEIVKAIEEGATEKALFWMRWLIDTDASMRKKNAGFGLTNLSRGAPGWPDKQRTNVGFFLANLAAETYKDLAGRGKMRMNEEFLAIFDLYRFPYKNILTSRRRLDLLCLMFQLLCEVPRWKIPAAAALVKDPIVLRKGIAHVENFFREVLAYEMPPTDIIKEAKKAKVKAKTLNGKSEKDKKKDMIEEQLAIYDKAIDSIMHK
jgi:hypothetical protein